MKAEWIWTDHRLAAHPRMIYFKKKVRLPEQEPPLACRLRICADSRYLLMINGSRVMTGPCRAPRGVRYMDELDVAAYLRPGENEIFVKVIQYPDHKEKNIRFLTGPELHCNGGDRRSLDRGARNIIRLFDFGAILMRGGIRLCLSGKSPVRIYRVFGGF